MKSFVVCDGTISSIVFHETAGKAKAFALAQDEYFEDEEYTDLTVHREPRADHLAKSDPYILDFCENAVFFRSLEWGCTCTDGCEKECVMKGAD